MPIWSPAFFGSGAGSSGFVVEDSIWLDGSADYLARTPASAGSTTKCTWSFWVKRSKTGDAEQDILNCETHTDGQRDGISFGDGSTADLLSVRFNDANDGHIKTNDLMRDVTAWQHWVVAIDTTQSTASNRVKIYKNGTQITAFQTASYPAEDYAMQGFMQDEKQHIGTTVNVNGNWFNGYLAEFVGIDGLQLDASSFGEYDDNGVWVPINPSGLTYGTNGFLLQFKETGSGQNASGIGADTSGKNNHFAVGGGAIQTNQVTDTPTDDADNNIGNYATLNPLATNGNGTISAGNLNFTVGSTSNSVAGSTIGVSSGKFYGEATYNSGSAYGFGFGIANSTSSVLRTGSGSYLGEPSDSHGINASNGNLTSGGAVTVSSYAGGALVNGTNYMWCLDMDNGKWWAGNADTNTWFTNSGAGNPATGANAGVTGLTGIIHICASAYNGDGLDMNFGQTAFTNASNIPTGFKALNTANLAAPTVTNPSDFYKSLIWTGDGDAVVAAGNTSRAVTGLDFQPDFVWIKSRSSTADHVLADSVRGGSDVQGTDIAIMPNLANAQGSGVDGGHVKTFDSNGFTVRRGDGGQSGFSAVNRTNNLYVAFCLRAGGAPTTDNDNTSGAMDDGSVFKSGSVQSSYTPSGSPSKYPKKMTIAEHGGFSIIEYEGTGSALTYPHGLDRAPEVVLNKCHSAGSTNWIMYHSGITIADTGAVTAKEAYLSLNQNIMPQDDATQWNDTDPTTTLVSLGSGGAINGSSNTMISYCFAKTPGLIGIGSYTGNGSADGPTIVVDDGGSGFRPAWVMIKRSDSGTHNWRVWDSVRSPFNVVDDYLTPNASNAEAGPGVGKDLDFIANGFKIRTTDSDMNTTDKSYIYLSFGEHPFGGDTVAQAKGR